VVAVAVDELAAAAGQIAEGFAAEARAEVAEALRAAVRRQDICTPWQEHLVIAVLPGVNRQQTPALRLRVQRALSEIRIVTHAGEELPIGFQVASACAPEDGTSEADLLAAAERRLAQHPPAPTLAPPTGANAQLLAALPILSN
jgi:GGDEF domain-containing protein